MSGVRIRAGLRPSEFRPRVPEVRPHLARKGETVKVYNATYIIDPKGTEKVVPVAAASLQHAARKAAAEGEKQGADLVKLELPKEILI